MQTWKQFPRYALVSSLLIILCAGLFSPHMDVAEAKPVAACPGGIIAQWTFTGNVITPSAGSGNFIAGGGISPASPQFPTGNPDPSISFISWDTPTIDETAFVEFQVSTLGRSSISLSFDFYRSNSGPTLLQVRYTTDGVTPIDFGSPISIPNPATWSSHIVDFSSVNLLDNNPSATFRIYAYSATGGTGTLRFDNVTISEICPTPTPTITSTPTDTGTPTNTATQTDTPTATGSPTNTGTPTSTGTPTATATSAGLLSVLINEVAWSGTSSSRTSDEWIELYNTGSAEVNLDGWRLTLDDGTSEVSLVTFGNTDKISGNNFFLLARETNGSFDIFNDVIEDKSFTTALPNSGIIVLRLYDKQGKLIDTANSGKGSGWYAGTASSTYSSMERNGIVLDGPSAWFTFGGTPFAHNRDNALVRGTPKRANWAFSVTATSTPVRTATRTLVPTNTLPPPTVVILPRPIINEILPRPGFDWNGDGRADVFDEFIEIKNLTAIDISLKGWKLDTINNKASFSLPDVTLKPGERIVFFSKETNLLLSDGGETVRLLNPSGKIYDAYTYSFAKTEDLSICRLPDGNVYNGWFEDCIPSPKLSNTREGKVPSSVDNAESPVCDLPDTIPADFFFAECHSYGAGIWNPYYWDQFGWFGQQAVPPNAGKWKSFVE